MSERLEKAKSSEQWVVQINGFKYEISDELSRQLEMMTPAEHKYVEECCKKAMRELMGELEDYFR